MYLPEAFRLTDRDRIAEVMRTYDFALLVTAPPTVSGGRAQASHLPFLYEPPQGLAGEGAEGTLYGHMARANPQWQDFAGLATAGQEALVVFQGPHSYISPTWYETEQPTVPTWRSEGRRVGKEVVRKGRPRGWPEQEKKTKK